MYLRVALESFENLLSMLFPLIVKQKTNFPQSITPTERLAVTLLLLTKGICHIKLVGQMGVES